MYKPALMTQVALFILSDVFHSAQRGRSAALMVVVILTVVVGQRRGARNHDPPQRAAPGTAVSVALRKEESSHMKFPHVTPRLIVALLIAVGGLSLAGWSLWPLLVHKSHKPVQQPLTPVQEALGSHLLNTDTGPGKDVASTAAERLWEVLRESPVAIVGPDRDDDLVAAFLERLLATTDPDYERDIRAQIARGKPLPEPAPGEEPPEHWDKRTDWTRGVRIGLEHLEVRTILERGEFVAIRPEMEGYSFGYSYKVDGIVFPLPEDPVASHSDIVEVRLPMGLRPFKVTKGKARGAVLVGYQFLWSSSRGQWIPYRNFVYSVPGEVYLDLPF
jgi:hypothetical protein